MKYAAIRHNWHIRLYRWWLWHETWKNPSTEFLLITINNTIVFCGKLFWRFLTLSFTWCLDEFIEAYKHNTEIFFISADHIIYSRSCKSLKILWFYQKPWIWPEFANYNMWWLVQLKTGFPFSPNNECQTYHRFLNSLKCLCAGKIKS